MTARITVCGEGLIDLVPRGDDLLSALPGGGPFNVAVALGRLGAEVGLLSRLSTDPLGERLLRRLRAAGVRTDAIQRGPEPTTLALTSLDAAGAADYTFYAGGTADRLVVDPGAPAATVRALSFGTLSLVFEPGATVYEAVLRRAHATGRLVLLDPNVRPGAIADPARYRERFADRLPAVDVLKVSTDDLAWLGGDPADWLAAGVGAVLLTQGGAGLTVLSSAGRIAVPAVPVVVADTIGAGDTVHAALLFWLDRRGALDPAAVRALTAADWAQALRFAARAAAVTVSRPGADPPWADELGCD
ncbi:carbohydrate kinase [Skermania piniformis]|uniref:Carbohydrate kinase n=1 Tax=Skermania pinensis TaxID=39122 RepID=A0ABX8SDV9_9ACTN|nr:carbohydrate kinase [Skermania piniformis]